MNIFERRELVLERVRIGVDEVDKNGVDEECCFCGRDREELLGDCEIFDELEGEELSRDCEIFDGLGEVMRLVAGEECVCGIGGLGGESGPGELMVLEGELGKVMDAGGTGEGCGRGSKIDGRDRELG